jgi:hypothetical protein
MERKSNPLALMAWTAFFGLFAGGVILGMPLMCIAAILVLGAISASY